MSHAFKIAQETALNFSEYSPTVKNYDGFSSLRFIARDPEREQYTRVHVSVDNNQDNKTMCLSIKIVDYAVFGNAVQTEIKAHYLPIENVSEFIYSRVSAHLDML